MLEKEKTSKNIIDNDLIVDYLGKLNFMQIKDLTEKIKEKFEIREEKVELQKKNDEIEKKEEKVVSIFLLEIGSNKIQIYNDIKDINDGKISIIQAREIADNKIIIKDISKEKAEKIKKKMEEHGAKIKIE